MTAITAKMVGELRAATGLGMMECKKALVEAEGDIDKAEEILRIRSGAKAGKLAGRTAAEGVISYVVKGNVGALVEINCETDFVAKTDDFHGLAKDIAMQIAAANPMYVRREEVPEEILEHEREILRAQALNEGKPAAIVEKMITDAGGTIASMGKGLTYLVAGPDSIAEGSNKLEKAKKQGTEVITADQLKEMING